MEDGFPISFHLKHFIFPSEDEQRYGFYFGLGRRKFLYLRIYRQLLIWSWRIKSWILYPIKYALSNFLQKHLPAFESKPIWTLGFKPKSIKPGETVCSLKPFGCLPNEMWLEISKFLDQKDHIKLLKSNKTFFELFGKVAYNRLQILITLSDLQKMFLNDLNYIYYGPDFVNQDVDSYDVFKRSKISQSYTDYEALDMKTNKKFDNKTAVIYRFSEAKKIFQDIIKNPDSVMKRFITDFYVDVISFYGFGNFCYLLDDEDPVSQAINKRAAINSDCFLMTDYSEKNRLFSFNLCDYVLGDRWQYPYHLPINEDMHNGDLIDLEKAKKTFPQNVYYHELSMIAYYYNFIYEGDDSRIRQATLKTEEDLAACNAFYYQHLKYPELTEREWFERNFYRREQKHVLKHISAKDQNDIEIENRVFLKLSEMEELMVDIVNTMTSEETCGGMNTSLSFGGTREMVHYIVAATDIRQQSTQTILLNKPRTEF